MIRLTDEQWKRIRDHFPEENIGDGRPGSSNDFETGSSETRRNACKIASGCERRGSEDEAVESTDFRD